MNYSTKKALDTIKRGTPNMYIGNRNAINRLQGTPLTHLIQNDDMDLVKYALDNNADPNQPEMWTDKWLSEKLSEMANDEIKKCEEISISNTGYFKFPDDLQKPEEGFEHYTYPLEIALRNGNYDIVLLLIKYGAKWELVRLDQTLFWVIISNQSIECVKILVEQGANPYAIITRKPLIDMLKERWTKGNYETFKSFIETRVGD